MKLNKQVIDITGNTYNRLTVIEPVEFITKISKKRKLRWLCECSCENKTRIITTSGRLRSGETKSCGCLVREVSSKTIIKAYTTNIRYHPRETSARSVYQNYKDTDLTFEEFFELSQQNCFYCGRAPSNSANIAVKKSSNYFRENCIFIYNGLDRINSNLYHIKSNVVPCCSQCNSAKSNLSMSDFIFWITKLCNFTK